MSKLTDSQLEAFIAHYQPKTGEDVHNALKDMFKGVIEKMLEGELEEELGYPKHQTQGKKTSNPRNGRSKKKVTTSLGAVELEIPRDREGEFSPQVVKKGQRDMGGLDTKILSLKTVSTK